MQLSYDDNLNEWLSPPAKSQFEIMSSSSMRKKNSKGDRANIELEGIELFSVDNQQTETPLVSS
jgi:hypothetical protein